MEETPEANKKQACKRAQEKTGGALSWLGGRCGAGGAVDGGNQADPLPTGTVGGFGADASDTRVANWTCRVPQSGQTRQSAECDGEVGDGVPPESSSI